MCWQGDAFVTWWIQVECQGSVLFHSQTLMHVSTRDWEQDCTTSQTELYRAIAVKGPAESNLLSRGRGGGSGGEWGDVCFSCLGGRGYLSPSPYTTILCTTSPLQVPPTPAQSPCPFPAPSPSSPWAHTLIQFTGSHAASLEVLKAKRSLEVVKVLRECASVERVCKC